MDFRKNHEKDKAEDTVTAPPPVTVPPPPEPAPYPAPGYPKVVFATKQHLPPVIVNNDAELAALNPAEWTTIPPQEKPKEDTWPKLYANVNILPQVVSSADEAAQLGSDWREFPLTQFLPPDPPAKK